VVSRARNLPVKDLLESECTDLLFIDSDINFEPEDVYRLMAWTSDPKKGIVGGVPRTRSDNKVYIASLDYDDNNDLTMDNMGLVRAKRLATAFMMVRRDVFTTLVDAHPEWSYYDTRTDRTLSAVFDFKLTDEGYMGEDYLFCDRAREHGFEVWVDPTIKLGHMGVQEYMGDFGAEVLYPMIAKPEAA
jgi:cellulose synthase/poly-beta-1,6-N-acetylglucosamine synthase-like glycosyltransferase